MPFRVIAVSRALAAGGEAIARSAAGELRFRYVDDDIITRAASHAGVSPETIDQVEHSRPLIERILESMASSAVLEEGGWADPTVLPSFSEPAYRHLIEEVIQETAKEGNVIIVAHAASIPLAGMDGLLRVLVTASPAVRAARLAQEAKLEEGAAMKAIERSDRERQAYFRRFYNLRQELPTHYDLVVNTDMLTFSQSARLIADAAKS